MFAFKPFASICFVFSLASILFLSCSKSTEDEDPDISSPTENATGAVPVTVTFDFTAEQAPMEASTRADKTAKDYVSRLVFKVFDSNNTMVYESSKKKDDNGFGNITFALQPGTYSFVAVGHKASSADIVSCVITSPTLATLQEQRIYPTYTCVKSVTVENLSAKSVSMEMKHATAKVCFSTTENPPSNYGFFRCVFNPTADPFSASTLNPTTRLATSSWCYTAETTSTSFDNIYFYTLVPAESVTVPLTVYILDANKSVLFTHSIGNVPLRLGYYTVIKGHFFSAKTDVTFTFDEDWQQNTGVSYNDF